MIRNAFLVTVAACSLMLGGCAIADPPAESDMTETQPDAEAETPAPEPEQSADPEVEQPTEPEPDVPVVLPECSTLDITEMSNHENLVVEQHQLTIEHDALGPAAIATIEQATRGHSCYIYLPNSGFGMTILIAEIPETAKTTFVQALRDSRAEESTVQGAQSFMLVNPDNQHDIDTYTQNFYIFVDDILVAEIYGTMGQPSGRDVPFGPTYSAVQMLTA